MPAVATWRLTLCFHVLAQASVAQCTTSSSAALSKDVAASISSIKAGTDMMRTQRAMYEQALARMQTASGFQWSAEHGHLLDEDSHEQDAGLWFESAHALHQVRH